MGLWTWRRAVVQAIGRLAAAGDVPGGAARWARRMTAMDLCGTTVPARVCVACTTPRPGSGGEPASPIGGQPCQARSCPFCGKQISRRLSRRLIRAVRAVPELAAARAAERAAVLGAELATFEAKQRARVAAGKSPHARWATAVARRRSQLRELRRVHRHRWAFVTLTVKWNPSDPAETTPAAYRARAEGLWRAISHAWDAGLNHGGLGVTALFARLEVNAEGFLHAHCLFRGGVINKAWLERTLAAVFPAAGFVKIKPVAAGAERDAVAEVAKYVVKSVGTLSTAWLANERRAVLHPELAAAVEVGLDGIDSHRSFGVLRGAGDDDDQVDDQDDDQVEDPAGGGEGGEGGEGADDPSGDRETTCRSCGTVGEFETRSLSTRVYARLCRRAGRPMTTRARSPSATAVEGTPAGAGCPGIRAQERRDPAEGPAGTLPSVVTCGRRPRALLGAVPDHAPKKSGLPA